MTGLEEVDKLLDAYKPQTTRPSLSQKTIDILDGLHPVLKRQESLALVERINRAYPIEQGHHPYRPFTPEEEARFRQIYDRDVEKIRAEFLRIRFLEP